MHTVTGAIASESQHSTPTPGLAALWRQTLGDPRVTIAVLDGPVDRSHPAFADADLTLLPTLVPAVPDGGPASQHGTHVASVIFARHDGRLRGVAPRCRGLIVPIYRDGPDGSLAPCSHIDLARALLQAAQHGANVVNISGGQLEPTGTAHPLLADAVQTCAARGVLIVAAAGNQGCDCLNVPAALPSVLAVGAMDSRGEPLDFSNWGQSYRTQGILAPGENISGAMPGGGIVPQSGTSYATAVVSGVVGLLLSLQLQQSQKSDAQAVRKKILDSALGCEYQQIADCRRVLAGRLNIPGAVSQIVEGVRSMGQPTDSSQETPASPPASIDTAPPPTAAPSAPVETAAVEPAHLGASTPSSPAAATAASTIEPPRRDDDSTAAGPVDPGLVLPAACGCQGAAPPRLVYALGPVETDFGTEARRDSIIQAMVPQANNPHDPHQLLDHLKKNPADAAAIIWTLNLDATPIYAIVPAGPFARETYERLRQFLNEQLHEGVERVSVPGHITGQVRLFTGQVVPIVHPEFRGMFSWSTAALVDAVVGPSNEAAGTQTYSNSVREFLDRVYHELRNLGVTPQERAINHAATNALNVHKIFESAINAKMKFDTIEVERSAICRPDSDCWDVILLFFDPENVLRTRKAHRFTVDVSDVIPVTVGLVRSWFVR